VLAQSKLSGIVLREKHISEHEYYALAKKAVKICDFYGMPCILHSFVDVALQLDHRSIHLPLSILEKEHNRLGGFNIIGCSTHSVQQAQMAERLGSTYITYGHIFNTKCKQGLPPRGEKTIADILQAVNIPVYPLGGINEKNYKQVMQQGAEGFAVMSQLMGKSYGNILQILD